MVNGRKWAVLAIAVGLLFAASLSFFASRAAHRPHIRKVILAVSLDVSSGPIFVAHQKGFFRKEGIDVSLLPYTSGKRALQSMREGQAQLATVADTVLMFAAFNDEDVCAIATISDANGHHRLIVRGDKGIRSPADLMGRKVGVTRGTTGEFFLYSFLVSNGIQFTAVRAVDLLPEDMFDALKSGAVDAVVTWYPTVAAITSRSTFPILVYSDATYVMAWNVVGTRAFLKENNEIAQRLIRGMLWGQEHILNNREESIAIIARFCNVDPEVFRGIWSSYNWDIRLGGSLLIDLDDQARWAIKYGLTDKRSPPDFSQFICTDPLREVDRQLVGLGGLRGNP